MRVHIDLESRSAVDLRKTGVYVYAESPTTDVWCAAYCVDDGPIGMWYQGERLPVELMDAIDSDATFHAWNANFEHIMWHHILHLRDGWPRIPLERWRCTMAAALAMGFPAALERAAPATGLSITKDAAGARLMKQMMRPRSINEDGTYVWWDEPEKIERLGEYCVQDVEVERQVHKRLVPLSKAEQELWVLDQQINGRGAYIDLSFCTAANKIVATSAQRLAADMVAATGGAVPKPTNVAKIKAFCVENGVGVDTLRKEQVAAMLEGDLPEAVREVLELRQAGGKTSVGKIDSALVGRSADGRAKGLFLYHGATTGRWAGRRVQLQNMQRPENVDVETIQANILSGDYDLVERLHGAPLVAISNAIRGIIRAAPGHKLIAGDFANIEGRVLAWLAQEQWKLDAFAAYDAGTGPDLYKVAYGRSFGIPPEAVNSDQRQIGKVEELALGFQGGAPALLSMARSHRVDIGQSYEMLCDGAPEFAARAEESYDEYTRRAVLAGKVPHLFVPWVAAEIVKLSWRDAHPNVVQFWRSLEDSAIAAMQVTVPGNVLCGRVCFRRSGSFLWVRLPSGRALCYPYPRLVEREVPWLDKRTGEPAKKLTLTFKTEIKRAWLDCDMHGGIWAENVTQAVARDLLAEAMKRLEPAGYSIVTHSHDEAVAEVPQDWGSVEDLCYGMEVIPDWAYGCPIAAAGWTGARYRKG